jgi:hypothetical protein
MDLWADKAVEWIEGHVNSDAQNPFFLFYAPTTRTSTTSTAAATSTIAALSPPSPPPLSLPPLLSLPLRN